MYPFDGAANGEVGSASVDEDSTAAEEVVTIRPNKDLVTVRQRPPLPEPMEDGLDPVVSMLREASFPSRFSPEMRRAKQEKARAEKEKAEKAQTVRERIEKEKAEKELLEKARIAKEEFEKERLEKARLEKDLWEKACLDMDELSRAQAEKARAEENAQLEMDLAEEAKSKDAESEKVEAASVPVPKPISEPEIKKKYAPVTVAVQSETAKPETVGTKVEDIRSQMASSEAAPPEDDEAKSIRRKRLLVVGAIALVGLVILFFVGRGLRRFLAFERTDRLMVASIENQTGDKTLDGVVVQGLEFALQESATLAFSGEDAHRWAVQQAAGSADRLANAVPAVPENAASARQAALAVGAKAYVYGTIRVSGTAYTLTVDVFNAKSNRKLTEAQETATSREQIVPAIDQIAVKLRSALGEKNAVVLRTRIPLNLEASSNLEALHQFNLGEAALVDGKIGDAISAFQSAATLDPKFIQAQVQLSWLYGSQHAEAASAAAAQMAEQAAGSASERTVLLSRYAYDVNAAGDLDGADVAIRRFVELYPHDSQGALGLARLLRMQGRPSEALDVAKRGIADDPYNAGLYEQAELALIGLDRYGDALELEQKSQKMALAHDGIALRSNYLAGQTAALEVSIERVERPLRSAATMADYGIYLDDTGQMAAGATLWRTMAAGTNSDQTATASGPWLLAQGALDRALVGDCDDALQMARTALAPEQKPGMTTNFNAGLAAALCGNNALAEQVIPTLESNWPKATQVVGFDLPELKAAVALGEHEPQVAIAELAGARANDPTLLTNYLRALAYLGAHQTALAVADLQTVLGHRGLALTGGSNLYPVAQSALIRAYAESDDKNNSAQASQKFMELWRGADPAEQLRLSSGAVAH
jgi:serine/threonine-protein kinase